MNARVSSYIIGIVIFTLVMVGGISLIGMMGDANPSMVAGDKYIEFNATANQLDKVTTSINSIGDSLDVDPENSAVGWLSALAGASWKTLSSIPTLFTFMITAYGNICDFLGIPGWIPALLSGVIIIIIIFAIIGAILQHDI